MSTRRMTLAESRTAAIDELFASLDAIMATYRSLPDGERDERMSADAVLITGEIARRLAMARAQVPAGGAPLGRAS